MEQALDAAKRAAPHLSIARLHDFLIPHMPRHPWCSTNIRCETENRWQSQRALRNAITRPWISLDGPHHRNVIIADVDNADAIERAQDFRRYGLPIPTVIADPRTMRAHATIRLSFPVNLGNRKAMELFHYAGRLLAAAMGGSLLPYGALMKSPWGLQRYLDGPLINRGKYIIDSLILRAHQAANTGLVWHTTPGDMHPVELLDLVEKLGEEFGPTVKRATFRDRRSRAAIDDALGRNDYVFRVTAEWCYAHVERDFGAIHDLACEINRTCPLGQLESHKEVAGIAGSIHRFMNHVYNSRGKGPDGPFSFLTPRERMILGGRLAGEQIRKRTDDQIYQALDRLRRAGRKITQAALAAEAGVGERTVQRRWRTILEACRQPLRSIRNRLPVGQPCGQSKSITSPSMGRFLTLKCDRVGSEIETIAAKSQLAPSTGPPNGIPMAPNDPKYHARYLGDGEIWEKRDGLILMP